jgi:glycosyltransferase involved in cell wall biosynthesis
MSLVNMDNFKRSIVVGEESLKIINNTNVNNITNINNSESWWFPSKTGNKRILFCGTYPIGTSNGYSKVVYYISKFLGLKEDVDLTIYGFQNFNQTLGASIRNDIPHRVKLHDAFATEEPKRNGFGEKEIGDFIKKNPQDVIIIFNDAIITSAITQTIINECHSARDKFRLVSYMDQVYPYQKKNYIEVLNRYFDAIIAFTPYWEGIARKLGIRHDMPIYHFPHGFDHKLYYPVPMNIARLYYKFDENAFIVLNLNRNQPRKRLDTMIIAWAEFVERHYQVNVEKKINKQEYKVNKYTSKPIKLIIGTLMDGYWDIMDVFENEIKFRNVPWEYAKNTIEGIPAPQQLSDRDINILYNACDVGLNSADGEGFGLCGFEGMALGRAQISANVGGMKEFLNEHIAILIEPKFKIYLDNKSNGIGGAAELTDPHEYAEAFWKYFSTPELMEKHGKKGRQHILTNYRWETLVEYFYKNVVPKL